MDDRLTAHQAFCGLPHFAGVVHEHIAQGNVAAVLGLVADHVFLAQVFGFDDNVAHLYKVREGLFHLAEPADTEPEETGDNRDAKDKAGQANRACGAEDAPAETIDDAD